MSNWGFVVVAYGLTWAVLAAYALYIVRRGRRARRELDHALRYATDTGSSEARQKEMEVSP